MVKNFLASKTVWLNFITLVMAVLALPEFNSIVPAGLLPFIAFISAIGNLILRIYFTSEPITEYAAGKTDL